MKKTKQIFNNILADSPVFEVGINRIDQCHKEVTPDQFRKAGFCYYQNVYSIEFPEQEKQIIFEGVMVVSIESESIFDHWLN